MKRAISFFMVILASVVCMAQVVLQVSTQTFTSSRNVTAVKVEVTGTNSLQMTAEFTLITTDTNGVIASKSQLRSVTLSGTNLDNSLSRFGLPSQSVLKNAFDLLWQDAWTNTVPK